LYVLALGSALLLLGNSPLRASTPGASEASVAKGKRAPRCVVRKLDVKTGMMITRYGCEKPLQGRWRDVGKALGSPPPP
jgi:hypothetical protein